MTDGERKEDVPEVESARAINDPTLDTAGTDDGAAQPGGGAELSSTAEDAADGEDTDEYFLPASHVDFAEDEDVGPEEEDDANSPEGWEGETDESEDATAARSTNVAAKNAFLDSTVNQFLEEVPEFEEVPLSTLVRLKKLFVKPDRFAPPLHHDTYLVHGRDRAGKWTCAVNLALLLVPPLRREHRIFQYLRPKSSQLPLAAALARDQWPEDSLVILRDCFDRNISLDELEPSQLAGLVVSLRAKNSVLILTGDQPEGALDQVAAEKVSAQLSREALHEVYKSNLIYHATAGHLAVSEPDVSRILSWWHDLQHHLLTPFHVSQLVLKMRGLPIGEMTDEILKERLVALAEEVAAAGGQATHEWFNALQPNEMLFALLVHLFDGGERSWLESLTERSIVQIRQHGFAWLSDPRECGLEDARENVHAVERGGRLEIEDRIYEREIRVQVRNRSALLWDVIEQMTALEPFDEWRDPWRRRRLGVALARVGIASDERRFTRILSQLAIHSERVRAVVAGYALQEALRLDPAASIGFVTRVMREWMRSRHPNALWTAGATMWRLYEAAARCGGEEQRAILEMTTQLAQQCRRFDPKLTQKELAYKHRRDIERCVVEAMRQIALIDPGRAGERLSDWLRSGTELSGLARSAVRAIVESFAKRKLKPTAEHQEAFIRLLAPLLEHGDGASYEADLCFLTLRAWLGSPEVEARAGSELLRLANYSNAQLRERLRSAVTRLWLDPRPAAAARFAERFSGRLKGKAKVSQVKALTSFWCEDPASYENARRLAVAVAVRARAADGALPLLPDIAPAVLVLDPALLGEGDAREPTYGFVWSLLALLESRFNLTVLRLGEGAPLCLAPEPQEESADGEAGNENRAAGAVSLAGFDPWPSFPTHRLVMPGLLPARALSGASYDTTRPDVILLADETPHDLDDLLHAEWTRSLHVLSAGSERSEVPSSHGLLLGFGWPPSADDLSFVRSAFEREWAREVASAPAERWGELLHDLGVAQTDSADFGSLLNTWTGEFESYAAETTGRSDLLSKAVTLLLYLAARNLPDALNRIVELLARPPSEEHPLGDGPQPEEGPSNEGRRAVAISASFALICLYTAFPPTPERTPRAPTSLFDSLAEPLGATGADGVAAVARLVSHWLEDPVWTEFLAGDVREGRGRLERWADRYLADRSEVAEELKARLTRAAAETRGDASWLTLTSIFDRLEEQRENEYPPAPPLLGDTQRYIVLVADPAPAGELPVRLRKVTTRLYAALGDQGNAFVPVIFRLGDRRPFWAAKEPPLAGRLAVSAARPRLVGPILEALGAWDERVAKVVLLVDELPLDLDDWADSAWWKKLTLYRSEAASPAATFAAIPRPIREESAASGTDEASRLAIHLAELDRRDFMAPTPSTSAREGATTDA